MAIKSYKGFDKNLRCRDFQYKIGGIYEMDGKIKVCNRGFHACESPFDVFDYYTMIDSRFCKVEQDGNISKEDRGTKICSSTRSRRIQRNGCRVHDAASGLWSGSSITGEPRRVGAGQTVIIIGACKRKVLCQL